MKIKECVLIEAFKCNENESVIDVAKKLRETSLRHIFVVNDEDYPTGIISVIDINNRVVAANKNLEETKAKDIMSNPIDIAEINDDVEEFSKKLIGKNHVMAPVVKEGKIIGIITINQLLKNSKL
ncbi:CBS domain-containing protein [Candidatus Pacearchaeota archaeon]|nr:CBS domain-containing protein [Candidatus Pacearchaeota archaeon]MBD3282800.1 CBS domain-containing protein [Candidatus Pacearchaeota archaeon]